MEYEDFEGVIPEGEYGAGSVIVWDKGIWEPLDDNPIYAYYQGHLRFNLNGKKLKGRWDLFKINHEKTWLIGIAFCTFILSFLSYTTAIVLLYLVYGFFGSMLIVPLNALIQFNAPRQEAGKVQSANNFLQNCFMLGFLGLTVLLSIVGVESQLLLFPEGRLTRNGRMGIFRTGFERAAVDANAVIIPFYQ